MIFFPQNSEFISWDFDFFLRILNFISCDFDLFSQNSEFISWDFDFFLRILNFISCDFELFSQNCEFISCNLDFFSQNSELYILWFWIIFSELFILQFWFFFLRIEFTFCNHEFISHNLVIFFSQNSASASAVLIFFQLWKKGIFLLILTFFLRIAIYKVIIVR